MLHEFLTANRGALIERCRAKISLRRTPVPTQPEIEHGIPLFLGQLIETLRHEQTTTRNPPEERVSGSLNDATIYGGELLRQGFTVDQVVRDYGDLCQAVTELAVETEANITVDEFRTFNACLDDAIADAVTEFTRQRDKSVAREGAQTMNERLGYLAHELRNLLNSAMLAFHAIDLGQVAVGGATGALLGRSLTSLRDLIDRSLAEVRLTEGLHADRERIVVRDLFAEVQVSAVMEALSRDLLLTIPSVEADVIIEADRQMLSAAIANLLQNAFKFTRPRSHVSLTARAVGDRVLIEVADECGGLSQGRPEELFQAFSQRGTDRTGLGLGLSISRRSVEANGGKLTVQNIPGTGCVFIIDLPRR